jgi:hypothetical protein
MKVLFHLTEGSPWREVPHEQNLQCAHQLVAVYGGKAQEVLLLERSNVGEPDPPYVRRSQEERAVVIDTTLEALAEWAADTDRVIHLMAATRWEDSNAGRLTHRIFASDPTTEGSDEEETGSY